MTRVLVPFALAAALMPPPIGAGPRYHPAAGVHGACLAAPLAAGRRMHLELFADGKVVIVPAAVGLGGARLRFGRVIAARCRARIWTSDPTGVVHFEGRVRLAAVFRVWGRSFAPDRLLSFHGRVRAYRAGKPVARAAVLRNGDEVVLEVGRYVRPHRSYRFP